LPKLLVLTLSSGEAALPVLARQLASQTFQDFEHEVIIGLPNRAAHAKLYRTIMERAASFDLFLKLDGDMTLRTPRALAEVVEAATGYPEVQHFAFPVWDCFTEEETLGVHLFRSGVRWGDLTDELFVDPDPKGVKQLMWQGAPAPFVNHGEIVSDFECFSFGVHKFLKVAQRGRSTGNGGLKPHKYARHMRNCARIRDLYRSTRARRHELALAGVIWAMEHAEVSALASKSELQAAFDAEIARREGWWRRRVNRLAASVLAWRLTLLRSLGPRGALT